jgi:outer membrane receptor for ferric coprogen and ferric-rhodotorulic acid
MPTHAPIVGARISVVSDGALPPAETMTNQRGEFTLVLEPGRYTLKAAADGFFEMSQRLSAAAGGRESREFVLEIAGLRDNVTVTAPSSYAVPMITSATKTPTPRRDVPQSVTVITHELIKDQLMMSVGDRTSCGSRVGRSGPGDADRVQQRDQSK